MSVGCFPSELMELERMGQREWDKLSRSRFEKLTQEDLKPNELL